MSDNYIVGLDIGSSNIRTLIGEVKEDEFIEIIGYGEVPSKGIEKGVVINLEAAVRCVEEAIKSAEKMADIDIASVYVSLTGSHLKSVNNHATVNISEGEVGQEDIDNVIEATKTIPLENGHRIIHILSKQFIVDKQEGIRDPRGMSGNLLEADVHIITGSETGVENIIKCVKNSGNDVEDIVLQIFASSDSVLTEDEKNLGVILIDIGGGTTDVAVFKKGAMIHSFVLPIGGSTITNDLAVCLKIPTDVAEELKMAYGSCVLSEERRNEKIEVEIEETGEIMTFTVEEIVNVIEARIQEITDLLKQYLFRSEDILLERDKCFQVGSTFSFHQMFPSGIVFTGGTSELKGITEFFRNQFSIRIVEDGSEMNDDEDFMNVKIGKPKSVTGFTQKLSAPSYATAIGLLKYGKREYEEQVRFMGDGMFNLIVNRFRNWLREIF